MRFRALIVAICALCLLPGAAQASVPPLRGAATHPLWGDSTRADFDQELDLLQQAGANVARIDIGWSTLEPEGQGLLNPDYVAKADQFFADAHDRGIKVVATFWTTPCWASSAPADVKQGCAGSWWERGVERYPPTDPAHFAARAAWAAQRWGADLAAIEVWNEPNYDYFFNTADPPGDYAELLNATYPAVKAAAPGVQVIGPAMLSSDYEFLDSLYDHGIAGHFDGVSLRPFNRNVAPGSGTDDDLFLLGPPRVRNVMNAHGDGAKKLWFTEVGWSSCTGTNVWCIGPELQAEYIADAYRIVRDRWDFVQLFSVYTLRNTGTDPANREHQMGMVQRDFVAKPAYDAFKAVLAEPLPSPPVTAAALPPPPAAPPAAGPKKPSLGKLALSSTTLGASWARTRFAYSLSQRARVTFTFQRAKRLRSCGCVRWVRFRGPLARRGNKGRNRLRLGTLLGKRRPGAGRYRLVLSAVNGAGGRSATRRLSFRMR